VLCCVVLCVQEEFEAESVLPLPTMPSDDVGQCFTVLRRPAGSLSGGKIANILKFTVKEIDPSSGEAEEEGYEDEYQVGWHVLPAARLV